MVRIGAYEFSLREFAGALGDFGPLNPFILGYIAVLGLDPAGIFLAMGVTNLIIGLVYKLPLPVEPQKAIGAAALNEHWLPGQIYISGLASGLIWLVLSFSGAVKKFAKVTPTVVIRGIQFGLMLLLLWEAVLLVQSNILLGLASVGLILVLMKNKYLPAAIALFAVGLVLTFVYNPNISLTINFAIPQLWIPSIESLTVGVITVILAQLVLTYSNAILATALAVNERFPESKLQEQSLSKNMGFMNTILSFIRGIPMCHGAGGFASQYFFGARTGGAMIMEGAIEVVLAFFFAASIASIFDAFPVAIIGGMLLFASFELGRASFKLRGTDLALVVVMGVVSFVSNLAVGFFVGLALFYVLRKVKRSKNRGK
ncbi:MAG: putative sulfate/molybdate transporter [Candidatus Bathyarchaeota archaeon]|nr:putative sulfate/molybdate transporter [Candidatus Bathyarchaeota archaeon]